MSKREFLNTQELVYSQQVWNGYSFLWKEASEIFWHQFLYDPIQDAFIKNGFEHLIQYGHPQQAVNFHVTAGIHGLIHNLAGPKLAHGIQGFLFEVGVHAGIKVIATATFPLIHPLGLTNNIPYEIKEYIIQKPIKFMGIHPLEIVNSVKVLPDQIIGPNNSISNAIDYLTLHKNHYHDRAENPKYEQFMNDYNTYMESIDAFVHMFDDFSVLYNNRHLNGITQKAYYWLQIKYKLYSNSKIAEQYHDHKVHHLRGSHEAEDVCLNEHTNWQKMIYSASSQAVSLLFAILVNKLYNYYMYSNSGDGNLDTPQALTTNNALVPMVNHPLDAIVQDTVQRTSVAVIKTLERTWKSEPNLKTLYETGTLTSRTLSDSHLLEKHNIIEIPTSPTNNLPVSSYTEGNNSPATFHTRATSYDELGGYDNKVYCTGDISSLIQSILPSRYNHICTTPSHHEALTRTPSQHFSPIVDSSLRLGIHTKLHSFPEIPNSLSNSGIVLSSTNGQSSSVFDINDLASLEIPQRGRTDSLLSGSATTTSEDFTHGGLTPKKGDNFMGETSSTDDLGSYLDY